MALWTRSEESKSSIQDVYVDQNGYKVAKARRGHAPLQRFLGESERRSFKAGIATGL
jgi:hypothetical protein